MTKREDGRWMDTITLPNGRRKYFYGKTKQEVNKKIREFNQELEKAKTISFRDLVELRKKDIEKSITYSTYSIYMIYYRRMVEFFGDTDVTAIKPQDVVRFRDWYDSTFQCVTQVLVQVMSQLSIILRKAVVYGYIDFNPARDIKVEKKVRAARREPPTDDEIRIMLANQDHIMGRIFKFALYTGLRKGELIALTWDDIDTVNRTVKVSKSAYTRAGTVCIKTPKTESGYRVVTIPNVLFDTLEPSTGPVFKGRKGGHMTSADWIYYCREYQDKTGLSCTAHQFRHAYATLLFDHDVEVKDSQRLLGHSNGAVTRDIYTHIRKVRENAVNERLRGLTFD